MDIHLTDAAPTDAEIREAYHKSYRYEKAQNYTDAIKALAPVVTAYPAGYTVNLRLGWLNYLTGGYATARKHYEAAIKTAPDSIEAKLGHTLPQIHYPEIAHSFEPGYALGVTL